MVLEEIGGNGKCETRWLHELMAYWAALPTEVIKRLEVKNGASVKPSSRTSSAASSPAALPGVPSLKRVRSQGSEDAVVMEDDVKRADVSTTIKSENDDEDDSPSYVALLSGVGADLAAVVARFTALQERAQWTDNELQAVKQRYEQRAAEYEEVDQTVNAKFVKLMDQQKEMDARERALAEEKQRVSEERAELAREKREAETLAQQLRKFTVQGFKSDPSMLVTGVRELMARVEHGSGGPSEQERIAIQEIATALYANKQYDALGKVMQCCTNIKVLQNWSTLLRHRLVTLEQQHQQRQKELPTRPCMSPPRSPSPAPHPSLSPSPSPPSAPLETAIRSA